MIGNESLYLPDGSLNPEYRKHAREVRPFVPGSGCPAVAFWWKDDAASDGADPRAGYGSTGALAGGGDRQPDQGSERP